MVNHSVRTDRIPFVLHDNENKKKIVDGDGERDGSTDVDRFRDIGSRPTAICGTIPHWSTYWTCSW
jgi:hypothetical protein